MKKLKVLLAALALLAIIPTAYAAEFLVPGKSEGNINIPSGQPHRNLYTAGSNINVNSEISGDLFAAGMVVNVASRVEEDLNAAGQTVVINAPVGGDIRAAGNSITVNSSVAGDILAGGASLSISSSSTVGGDVIAGGAFISIDAPVTGKVWISAETVRINSRVAGEVKIKAKKLTFGPDAEVTGRIEYSGPEEAVVEDGAQVSTINFTRVEANNKQWHKGFVTILTLIHLVALFIAGWLLGHFKRQTVLNIMQSSSVSPLLNLGIGFAALIATPFLVLLLMVTFIGYYLALLVLFSYILLLLLACLVAALYTGSVIWQWFTKSPSLELSWKTVLLGVVVYKVISWIPYVGWAVVFIIFLITLGAIVRMFKHHRQDIPIQQ